MKDDFPRYTLRIPQILLDKLGYIAEYEGRTKNKEIEQLIRAYLKTQTLYINCTKSKNAVE